MRLCRGRLLLTAAIAAVAGLLASTAYAAPSAKPYRADDACDGRCRDVLPPGTDGTANFGDLLGFLIGGKMPADHDAQLAPYADFVRDYRGLTAERLEQHFKDHSFGVPAELVARRYSPRGDVTIVRDRPWNVPHVYGQTRAGTMFGAGYVAAQDRLFLVDVLRHVGRGELTSFAGGALGNREFEQDQWRIAPYTEDDLRAQYDRLDDLYGSAGEQLQDDMQHYVDGLNQYVSEQKLDLGKRPGEYTALGMLGGPARFEVTDVVATASLVGGIFGEGGGGEVASSLVLARAQERFGRDEGARLWAALRSADDPDAPTTVKGARFPYPRTSPAASARALPDGGRVVEQPLVTEPTGSALPTASAASARAAARRVAGRASAQERPLAGLLDGGLFRRGGHRGSFGGASNALVVSASESASGHPLAVFGPQTSYFAPQLLLEQELQGPGISAKGASFAGVSMYVQLGRGRDYAWSATSANQDIADTFAVELCEPDGSTPTRASMSYVYRGACLPIEVLRKHNAWKPSLADSTPAGSYTLEAQRTKLGLVTHRGTVDGRPVAYTVLRSTYFHEADSALGFSAFNDPRKVSSPATFQKAASDIGYTFNWFYVDAERTAYFNSGAQPLRDRRADPDLPVRSSVEWQGYDPDRRTSAMLPANEHPQAVDQPTMASWNNRQAPGFRAADDTWDFGPLYRVSPLEDRIAAGTAGDRRMTREELTEAMEDAGTVDLRGDAVLPWALRVLGVAAVDDPQLRDAVAALRAWQEAGAHRIDRDGDGTYEHAEAIRIMDAWWPRWVARQFRGRMGADLYEAVEAIEEIHDAPGANGSAFQHGWYGWVQRDLRQVLGERVGLPFPRPFCGDGDAAACRAELLGTLKQALAVPATDLYVRKGCEDGDQACFDMVEHKSLGGVKQPLIPWINRPTYQQVIEFGRRLPR